MNEFIVIKVMNEAMLKLKKSKHQNYVINEKIKKKLEDEAFFFKINKDIAIKVLTCVGVSELTLEKTYLKLIRKEMYDKLVKNGRIKTNDNLVVRYK